MMQVYENWDKYEQYGDKQDDEKGHEKEPE